MDNGRWTALARSLSTWSIGKRYFPTFATSSSWRSFVRERLKIASESVLMMETRRMVTRMVKEGREGIAMKKCELRRLTTNRMTMVYAEIIKLSAIQRWKAWRLVVRTREGVKSNFYDWWYRDVTYIVVPHEEVICKMEYNRRTDDIFPTVRPSTTQW